MTYLTRTLASISLFIALAGTRVLGQSTTSYLNDIGDTAYGVNVPVENGFINLSNGNLHLEFPLSTHPQRGALTLAEKLTYDSRIWNFTSYGSNGSYHWWPYNVPGTSTTSGGWQFVTGGEVGAIAYSVSSQESDPCGNNDPTDPDGPQPVLGGGGGPGGPPPYNGPYVRYSSSAITWTDPSGSAHRFNASINSTVNECDSSQNSSSLTGGYATDGSGYHVPSDPSGTVRIIDANSTQVYPNIADRYGNQWQLDSSGNLTDDTGQIPVLVTQNGLVTYYDVLSPNGPINNQGNRVRYTVTNAPVNVNTQFLDYSQSDIHGWVSSNLLTPVQSIGLPDGSQYFFTYDINGELFSMLLPTGGLVRYGYTDFVDSAGTENNWLSLRKLGTARGLSQVESFTPLVGTTCSNYSTGCVEFVIHHRPSGDETLHQLTLANGAWNTDTGVYTGAVPVMTHPVIHPQANNRLSYTTTTYKYSNACSGPSCIGANYVTSSLATTLLSANGTPAVYSQAFSSYDPQTGKPISVKEWDYSSQLSSMNYSAAPSTTPTRDTEYSYTGLDPHTISVYDSSGQQVGLTTYAYTNSATSAGTLPGWSSTNAGGPYLQSVSHWINTSSTPSTTTYAMDTSGMLTSVLDPKSNSTTFQYQCSNSLPYKATNALQQTSQSSYDCASGAISALQDPNDLATGRAGTTYLYDSIGRLSSVSNPDGGSTSYNYISPVSVQTTVSAAPDPDIVTTSELDQFGRPWKTSIQGIETDTTYDDNGRVQCVSNPWATTEVDTCVTAYDGLDRPLIQVLQDGVSARTTSYVANTMTSTDERGVSTSRTVNAFGELVGVTEPAPAGTATTSYSYDGLGNIAVINQAGAATNSDVPRIRTFTYDSVSRLVCASAPESAQGLQGQLSCPAYATTGAPAGTTSYTYNLDGSRNTRTDALGIVTTYAYDALNRLHWKSYSGGSGTGTVGFGYDGKDENGNVVSTPHANTIGRLTHISNLVDAASTYSYDAMGRLVTKSDCLPPACSIAATTNAQYNLAGNVTDIYYPDQRHVNQHFDAFGRLSTVGNGNSTQSYVQAISHDSDGLLDTLTLGNAVTQTTTRNNRLQIQNLRVSTSLPPFAGQNFSSRTYCYVNCLTGGSANNGTIWGIADDLNGQRTQGFTYDSLNRIASFSVNGQVNQQYQTDAFGNLSGMANGNPITTFDRANRASNLPCAASVSPTYDAVGNQLCDLDANGLPLQFVYDAENRLTQLRTANASGQPPLWTYVYGADGDRVYKQSVDQTAATQYVYFNGNMIAERSSGGLWTDYIYAGAEKVAVVNTVRSAIHMRATRDSSINMACGTIFDVSGQASALRGYTIQQGDGMNFDHIEWLASGGPSLIFTDGTFVSGGRAPDGQWHHDNIDLSSSVGKTISSVVMGPGDPSTPQGTWDMYIRNLVLQSMDGTVHPAFTGGSTTGSLWNACGGHDFAFEVIPAITGDDFGTNFYIGDHLGSASLEFGPGGWPLSSTQYAPFGEELPNGSSSADRFKFTGMERDGELRQDHAQFRQLAYLQGRWTSTDPYDGSMDFSNPQSLNRYSYVNNMPMSLTDPSGLLPLGCGLSTAGSDGATTIVFAGGAEIGTLGFGIGVVEAAACLYSGIMDIVDLFSHPKFTESHVPRPGNIWNEHGGYKVHPFSLAGDALGLGQTGCEFGACGGGGPSDFQQAGAVAAPAIGGAVACAAAEPCGAIALGVGALIVTGVAIHEGIEMYKARKPSEATCRKIVQSAKNTCTARYPFASGNQSTAWRVCVRQIVEPTGCDF